MAVHCSECGFLSLRDPNYTVFLEADQSYRQTGDVDKNRYAPLPVCIVMAANLQEEMKGSKREFNRVVCGERTCPKFTPWLQGCSPKDHQQMVHEQRLLEWQQEQRKSDREWQESVRLKDKMWQEQQEGKRRDWEAKQRRTDRRFNLVAVLLGAIIGGVLTLAAQCVNMSRLREQNAEPTPEAKTGQVEPVQPAK